MPEWIPMRKDLHSGLKVHNLTRDLYAESFDDDGDPIEGVDVQEMKATVVGMLHRLWSAVDSHSEDGRLRADAAWVDEQAGRRGFAKALVDNDWLVIHRGHIEFPNWEALNGATARRRENDAERARKYRERKKQPEAAPRKASSPPAKQPDNESAKRNEHRQVEVIRLEYPRKIARPAAQKAIRNAIVRVSKGDDKPDWHTGQWPPPDAAKWVLERTRIFADSPAGNAGQYTPHPSTWFNEARYSDDDSTYQRTNDDGRGQRANRSGASGSRSKPGDREKARGQYHEDPGDAPDLLNAGG